MDAMVLSLAPYPTDGNIKNLDMSGSARTLPNVQRSGRRTSTVHGVQPMFVSQTQYEFPFPASLCDPGSRHWRMVELALHAPWFLLSVEILDQEVPEHCLTRTLCIAWEFDLADVLRSLDPARVKGIVCMMPSWRSETGQWASREIHEVWLCKSASGERVVLGDATGQEFDCGVLPEHELPLQRELLLRMSPARPRKRRQPSSDLSGAPGARTERGGT